MSYELKIMIKAAICALQLVCLYHVLKHDRAWLAIPSALMAILTWAI